MGTKVNVVLNECRGIYGTGTDVDVVCVVFGVNTGCVSGLRVWIYTGGVQRCMQSRWSVRVYTELVRTWIQSDGVLGYMQDGYALGCSRGIIFLNIRDGYGRG